MVIEAFDNVVYVSGALHTNHWSAIRNMVDLISAGCPYGVKVRVDFANVTFLSKLGEMTFSEALCDIEHRRLPIILVNLPASIQIFMESLSSDAHQEHSTKSEETRRIHAAIYSDSWWQSLWGQVA